MRSPSNSAPPRSAHVAAIGASGAGIRLVHERVSIVSFPALPRAGSRLVAAITNRKPNPR